MVAQCVVCAASASVFCKADAAFLCGGCDKTIHSANVLASRHVRVPVCELCKRAASTVYCPVDAASLCPGCDRAVHESNPLPHAVVPIEQALESKPSAPVPAPAVPSGPAEDEVSACGEHDIPQANTPGSEPLLSSELNTSVAIVPEMPNEETLGAAFASKDAPWGKELENLDLDAVWMDGFDFSDILGNDLGDAGLVPTFNSAPEPMKQQQMHLMDDDLVVPTLDLPASFMEPVLSAPQLPAGSKRSADMSCMPQPPPKVAAVSVPVPMKPHSVPVVAAATAQVGPRPVAMSVAVAPAMMIKPVDVVAPVVPYHQQAAAAAAAAAAQQAMLMNGANLTREQRVARYREKRKNRKFQKTIRYASRKAYAEVRPRIKGRFATREEVLALKAAAAAGHPINLDDDCVVPTLLMA